MNTDYIHWTFAAAAQSIATFVAFLLTGLEIDLEDRHRPGIEHAREHEALVARGPRHGAEREQCVPEGPQERYPGLDEIRESSPMIGTSVSHYKILEKRPPPSASRRTRGSNPSWCGPRQLLGHAVEPWQRGLESYLEQFQ